MRFLCLHGMGSNSQVFEAQIAAIRYELADRHEYEFVEGCIPSAVSPDLGNVVASDNVEFFSYANSTNSDDDLAKAVDQLDKYIAEEGPFDGVLAFSEGATVAMSYMVTKLGQGNRGKLRVAFLFSTLGCYDPFQQRELLPEQDGEVIQIPTVHVWGRNDKVTGGLEVSELCARTARYTFVHGGGHEIPGARMMSSVKDIAQLMRRAIHSATGPQLSTVGQIDVE